MKDFKSIQELIIKAAIFDKVVATIDADELFGGRDVLRITFSKNSRYTTTYVDLLNMHNDRQEEYTLKACKKALYDLLEAPYEDIIYPKENHND